MDRKAAFNALKKKILLPFDQPAAGRMAFAVDRLDQALGAVWPRGGRILLPAVCWMGR